MTNFKIKKPLLSVYMPVFNAAPYLSQSIESILSQSYSNFEFIIVDDGSTDNSWSIIKKYARLDKRIRLIRNKINLGVSASSNIAISQVRGKFLARMDSDDISTPDRLKKELIFLRRHPSIVVVGSQCFLLDENDISLGFKRFPTDPKKLSAMIFWAVPIQQSSMMINLKKLPVDFPWYIKDQTSAEEINLMFRLLKYGQLANLPDHLTYYRQLSQSLSHINPKKTFWITISSRLRAVKQGFQPSFLAILINILQVITITFLPNRFIYPLWHLIRGFKQLAFSLIPNPAKISAGD
jgi:glycosyltransferase involved in cell wall biosynthesis